MTDELILKWVMDHKETLIEGKGRAKDRQFKEIWTDLCTIRYQESKDEDSVTQRMMTYLDSKQALFSSDTYLTLCNRLKTAYETENVGLFELRYIKYTLTPPISPAVSGKTFTIKRLKRKANVLAPKNEIKMAQKKLKRTGEIDLVGEGYDLGEVLEKLDPSVPDGFTFTQLMHMDEEDEMMTVSGVRCFFNLMPRNMITHITELGTVVQNNAKNSTPLFASRNSSEHKAD